MRPHHLLPGLPAKKAPAGLPPARSLSRSNTSKRSSSRPPYRPLSLSSPLPRLGVIDSGNGEGASSSEDLALSNPTTEPRSRRTWITVSIAAALCLTLGLPLALTVVAVVMKVERGLEERGAGVGDEARSWSVISRLELVARVCLALSCWRGR